MTIDQWFFMASDGERYQLMATVAPSRHAVSVTRIRARNVQRNTHQEMSDLSVLVHDEFRVTSGVRRAVQELLNQHLESRLAAT